MGLRARWDRSRWKEDCALEALVAGSWCPELEQVPGYVGREGNPSVPVGTGTAWGQGSLAAVPPLPAPYAASLLGPAGLCRLCVFAAGTLRPCPGTIVPSGESWDSQACGSA